ncbi:Tyrosine recombinase XerC [subsurface metagenome]
MPFEARAMKDLRGFLTREQVEAMIEGCDNLRDRLLIRLLWRTGMRISELVRPGKDRSPDLGLRVTDILWQENTLVIRHAKRSMSKLSCANCGTKLGRKFKFCPTCQQEVKEPLAQKQSHPIRRIDIDPGTLAKVKEYLEKRPGNSEFVINITRQMAYLVVRQAAERIGITEVGDPLVSQRRHPHPHHLRHSLAVHSVRVTKGNYADLIRLQQQLGHASIATTAGYIQFSDEEQRKWYDELWKEKKNGKATDSPE